MNSIFLLVIWSAFLNSPGHNVDGAIHIAQFATQAHCEFALKTVKDAAKNISGVCVPQGTLPGPSVPGKSGPGRQVRMDLR